jgi:hypothetical protein
MEPTMSGSEDGERTLLLNNGISMRSQRPSRTTNGSHTHLIFKETEALPTSDVPLPTQDGGNSSSLKELSLKTLKTTRYLMSLEDLMESKRISLSTLNMARSTSNLISCMLMNGRVSQ